MAPVYKLSASSIKGRTNYGSMLAGNTVYEPPTAFESISTTTVGSGGSATITFSSIPSTYSHLQVRMMTLNASAQSVIMQFNSDTGSNYAKHSLNGNGVSATGQGYSSQSYFNVQGYRVASSGSNPVAAVVDILDYANTNKYKTARMLSGFDSNGNGEVDLNSGLWSSTSAITSIQIKLEGGANFSQYSHFALYGIRSA